MCAFFLLLLLFAQNEMGSEILHALPEMARILIENIQKRGGGRGGGVEATCT